MDQKSQSGGGSGNFFTEEVKTFFWDLPCLADWYRYVAWHNHAIALTKGHLGLSVQYSLYYEDYSTSFDKTVMDLLNFLELETINDSTPFSPGHTYETNNNNHSIRTAAVFVRTVCHTATWKQIQQYFKDWL